MGMTVRQAAEYSGYIYQANVGGKKPFVLVFLPSTKDEVISPTWGELMPRMKDLVANQQNLCPE